jgi:hypothetical protein
MPKRLTLEEFISRSHSVHQHKYDYSKTKFVTLISEVIIICHRHGEFSQKPRDHIAGCGCPCCGRETAGYKISSNISRAAQISKKKLEASKEAKALTNQRRAQTLLEKYGVDNPAKLPGFRDKLNLAQSMEVSAGLTARQIAREKAKITMLQKYGVDNIFKRSNYIQDIFMEKYGVRNPGQVGEISQRSLSNSLKSKIYTMPSGKEIKVQGYEDVAIDWLLKSGIPEDDIITDRNLVPKIWYVGEDDNRHRYYPDIFVPSQNQLYEVKGLYTYNASLSTNLLKQEACVKAGFLFSFLICNKKGVLDIK